MEVIQKKGSNKHTFLFKDDAINFAYKDKNGSGDVDLYYADIPKKSSIRIEQNDWLKNVGCLWLILGVFQAGFAIYAGYFTIAKALWVFLGAMCLAWFYFTKIKYTVFHAEKGSLFIVQTDSHDRIIEEIMARKNKQLLAWYGNIDFDNEPEREKSKFKWLCDQGVITNEVLEMKIAQIELYRLTDSTNSTRVLN
ncbi:hypothetical protein [Iodobacter fluviatilis]|uniref:Uncharacterized protein n=1 Tax=Iodobacter fluviatilis TaxID=537 RepID=A0A377QA12_9NEIS|nr:hypothetical protein [Iodobacter fluviatilis]TCU81929.1 hypothetical protein EV682_11850 [Iodobacter fluviatilis]STQ91538.1 Uncharacterised protein [Iodobacter fluviatilis]